MIYKSRLCFILFTVSSIFLFFPYNRCFNLYFVVDKNDMVISMPSGFGKTICYQLPALLECHQVTVVFSPSIIRIKVYGC